MNVVKRSGKLDKLNVLNIRKQTQPACAGLNLSYEELELDSAIFFKDNIKSTEIQTALIKTALNKVDIEKSKWTFVAARLSLYDLYHRIKIKYNVKGSGDVYEKVTLLDYISNNRNLFSEFHLKYTDDEINELNSFINKDRDLLFDYLGYEVTLSKHLMKDTLGDVVELPQHFHMTVAMYIGQDEKDKLHWVKQFYEATSTLKVINATPINSNGRKKYGSTASCMIGSIPDDLNGIFDGFKEIAQGSKAGAGWGIDVTRIRAIGSIIRNVIGAASGSVPLMKILNDISIAINQLGNRPGAFAIYMESWSIDIFDFLDLKKKNGDDRRRAQDLFIAVSLSDVFMERERNNDTWTLFDPYDTPDLCETYGDEFKRIYENYEKEYIINPDNFNINTRVIPAKDLMRKIGLSYFEEGQPFLFFKDTVNEEHKREELGIIRSSNLCVVGDTNILTKEYGYTPIGPLVDSGVTSTECWNGEEWSNTVLFKTSNAETVMTIGLSNGQEITATEYHKWYKPIVNEHNKVTGEEEVRTSELNLGDELINFNLPIVSGKNETFRNPYNRGVKTDKSLINAFVPNNDFETSDVLEWLSGFIDTNGLIKNKNKNNEYIKINFATKQTLIKVSLLLQELGVKSDVKNGCVYNAEYELIIYSKEFIKLIDLGYSSDKLLPTVMDYVTFSNIFLTVTSIKYTNMKLPTYCGNEPKRNKLMFNGVLTGNCTEYMGPTDGDDIPVCNLGSLNLARIKTLEDLYYYTSLITRMLDNIIDVTEYPNEKTKQTQMKRRAIGIGALGEAEMLVNNKIHYGSDEHKEILETIYTVIEEASDETSKALAIEKGGCYLKDIRNAYLRCVAPNSSSGIFAGTTNSHEPVFDRVWIEDNMLGMIKVTAPNLNVDNYKYYVGAYDVDQKSTIDLTKIRQDHVDMGISHNIYLRPEDVTLKTIVELIRYAHKKKLKTTYYLRSKPPSNSQIKSDDIACFGCNN